MKLNNNIYIKQGDSREILKKIKTESIDLIISDIPYKTTSRGCAGNSGGMLQKDINKKGKVFENNDIHISQYAQDLYRVLKDGTHCYIMTNHINLQDVLKNLTTWTMCKECGHIEYNMLRKSCKNCGSNNILLQDRFKFIKNIIWQKDNKIMGTKYMSQYEYILFLSKGKSKNINNCGTSDILSVPNKKTKDENGKNLHDTEKPVDLMKILIENSSQKGEVVLDPFMGIGSTGLACMQTDRIFYGIELDEKYFNIAKERIENYKERITNDTNYYNSINII